MKTVFTRFSLQTKLFLAFSIVSLFVILVGGASFYFGKKTVDDYRKIALKNLPASVAAANLRGLSKDVRATLLRMGSADASDDVLEAANNRLSDLLSQFDDGAREYKALPFVANEDLLFENCEKNWREIANTVRKAADARIKGSNEGTTEYNQIIQTSYKEANSAFTESINELVVFHQELATRSRETAELSETRGNRASIFLICFGFLIAIGIGFFFGRILSKSLLKVSDRLNSGTQSVENSASAISEMSSNLESQTQDQAAAIQKTSAAVTQISTTVATSAESAKQTQTLSHASQSEVQTGQNAVIALASCHQKLSMSLGNIFERVNDSSSKMDILIQIIREIEGKTNVINEIVFQTKLLSFNASVEAARAGEAGKGFSVVAEEVGNLARMSGKASEEISTMLSRSIRSVNQIAAESKSNMASAISEANKSLNNLTQSIDTSRDAFDRISQSAGKVAHEMNQVCLATSEQSVGMNEISDAINKLETTTQMNSAISENAATTAKILSSEVDSLRGIIKDLLSLVGGGSSRPPLAGQNLGEKSTFQKSTMAKSA